MGFLCLPSLGPADVRHDLDWFLASSIQVLVLGPVLEGDGANLSRICPTYGSLEQLQGLVEDGRKQGMKEDAAAGCQRLGDAGADGDLPLLLLVGGL